MSWLAAVEGGEAEMSLPTHDIAERFLRWVTEPALRQVALLAAIPRTLNADVLKLLLEQGGEAVDEQSAFDWLQTMPFVKQGAEGWYYHDVVRRMMLHYQRRKSPQTYRWMHGALANCYNTYRDELCLSEEEQWINEAWRKHTLAHFYHFLVADPNKHWGEAISLFVVAMRKRRSFAVEIVEFLNLDDIHDELSSEQNDTLEMLRRQLQTIKDGSLLDGFEMFDKLCGIASLSIQAKGYSLAYRGECHRLNKRRERALSDFNEALQYAPEDDETIAKKGITYLYLDRYEDALTAFGLAISLNEKNIDALAYRGTTYRMLGRNREALADLDQVIALDEKNAWALYNRGEIYRMLGRNREALADLDQAIALDEKATRYFAVRGAIYRAMQRYQEALVDLDQAISSNKENAWATVHRGMTYRAMGRHAEALADFDRAIALNEKDSWALANRGETYLRMGRYQKALTDFNRAIALDEKVDWYRYERAQIYLLTGQMGAFESDLHTAIELAKATLSNTPDNWHIGFNLALYNLVAGNLIDTESQYTKLVATCSSLPDLQGATEDLTDLLSIQPSNELAQRIRTHLQTRITELQQSPTE